MYKEQDKFNRKICVLTMATGPYKQFLPNLIASINQYFLPGYDVTVHVYTDEPDSDFPRVRAHFLEHIPARKWYPTLDRFHIFVDSRMVIDGYDNYVYLDSDTLLTDYITEEILGDRVYVQHCGFVNRRGPYESNENSACYVGDENKSPYIAGSIWAFSNEEFWKFMDNAIKMVEADIKNRILPVWADESVINRYSLDNPATTLLDPSYHYPEYTQIITDCWHNQGLDYPCKVLQLDKSKHLG